ncbi:hypothetical protein [Sphingomonas sp. Ant20]|jgi:hypothetical protein|uniref:hypothetical protein n=1 Tax=Sphingomonas sp. Ant20 TaxID=104605 RepID=UPI0005386832|nr:hypothetical protein [Sphingomonas sp. Ant20]KHA63590.1 hypothetical protein NI18_14970 [Sphingomonas sp. Ant20]
MSDYRGGEPVRQKSGAGKTIVIVLVVIAAIVGVLFATGFWSANVKEGSLPEFSVKGGDMPNVDLDSKAVVVGTKKTEVEVPKVKTETETVDVPTVGVKDNGEK